MSRKVNHQTRKLRHETITAASPEEAESIIQGREVLSVRMAHDPATCTWSSSPPLSLDCACEPEILLYVEPAGLFQ